MKRLLDMAGVPEAVIAEIPEILKKCKVCRTWERPQMKPMARTELSLDINKKVFADVIFYTMQDGTEILVLHMMDDATRWKMLHLLPNRTFAAFQEGIGEWCRIFGPPEVFCSDQETGLQTEEMAVWLESI